MAQVSSNTLAFQQIYSRLRSFFLKDVQNQFKSNQERLQEYNDILSDLYKNVSAPITKYDPYIKGEPPRSGKFNKFSQDFSQDIRNAASQTDYLSAKIINVFNMFTNEIQNEKKYIERISSKSKILQMYNRSESEDLIYLGDSFDNMDYIDVSQVKKGLLPLVQDGALTLPVESIRPWPVKNISITSGNGFLGNNHEVRSAISQDGYNVYSYVGLENPGIASLSSVSDSNPLTYFEYEALNVDKSGYAESSLPSDNEFCYVATANYDPSVRAGSLVDWSRFDESQPLSLTISLESTSASLANSIEIVPYFASMGVVKVSSVKLYGQDGSYEEALVNPFYIGSSLDPLSINVSKNYYYNKAQIKFNERILSKVDITFEQNNPKEIEIMHAYWKPNYPESSASDSPFVGLDRFSPDLLTGYVEVDFDIRKLLPIITNPFSIKQSDFNYTNCTVSTKKDKYTDQFNIITFEEVSTGTKFYFSDFKNWPPPPGEVSLGPTGLVFSDTFIYDEVYGKAKRYSKEEETTSDLSQISLWFANNSDYIDGSFKILNTILFEEDSPFDDEYIYIKNIQVENYSHQVDPQTVSYNVPLSKEEDVIPAKRFAIGLRDVSISYEKYSSEAEIVSKPFIFDSPVETLMLSTDLFIERENLQDISINYYVSDGGSNWIQISPIQLDYSSVPEVIAFNQNIPETSKLPGVSYFNYPNVSNPVNTLIFKMSITKNRNKNITPLIYSYQLIAKVRT